MLDCVHWHWQPVSDQGCACRRLPYVQQSHLYRLRCSFGRSSTGWWWSWCDWYSAVLFPLKRCYPPDGGCSVVESRLTNRICHVFYIILANRHCLQQRFSLAMCSRLPPAQIIAQSGEGLV